MKWYTSASVYAEDIIILGGSVCTAEDKAKTLVVACKEIGL